MYPNPIRVDAVDGPAATHIQHAPQIHHLKAQLALRKEEAVAEADEFREHSLRQAEEVRT